MVNMKNTPFAPTPQYYNRFLLFCFCNSQLGPNLAVVAGRVEVLNEVTCEELARILTMNSLVNFRLKILGGDLNVLLVHACNLRDARR
jgi:hypothetical protein